MAAFTRLGLEFGKVVTKKFSNLETCVEVGTLTLTQLVCVFYTLTILYCLFKQNRDSIERKICTVIFKESLKFSVAVQWDPDFLWWIWTKRTVFGFESSFLQLPIKERFNKLGHFFLLRTKN